MAAAENIALKDEVDALRETAAKAAALEATVASYKKRMEEHVDLRRQVHYIYCFRDSAIGMRERDGYG